MRAELDQVLREIAGALRVHDEDRALHALRHADELDDRRLASALELGREVVRRAPRRRRLRRQVNAYGDAAQALRTATRDIRILAVGAIRLIRSGAPIPPSYADAIEAIARNEAPSLPRGESDTLAGGIVEEQVGALTRRLRLADGGDLLCPGGRPPRTR
jgi:hypothetical protein